MSDEDAMWRCYVCDPKPLARVVQHCTDTLKRIEEEETIVIKDTKEKAKQVLIHVSSLPTITMAVRYMYIK